MYLSGGGVFTGILILIQILNARNPEEDHPVVRLPMGQVKGTRRTVLGRDLELYLGIPFAKPPIGDLRYKKPVPLEVFESEIQVDSLPPACFQINPFQANGSEYYKELNMSEDCLYLNLWIPKKSAPNSEPFDVMVWIYGGGYTQGSSGNAWYRGEMISALGNVIVASMNYRVGAMGFLTAGTREEPGNIGLYDQNLALKWIKNNVAYFGGNPNTITIFGESAGGISVGLHLTSPFSKGLFQRAIIMSGVNVPPYRSYDFHLNTTQDYASFANCTTPNLSIRKDPESILTCLRSLSPEELSEAEFRVRQRGRIYGQFGSILGEDFSPYASAKPIAPLHFNDHDIVIGITANEGSGFVYEYFNDLIRKESLTKTESYKALLDFLKHDGGVANANDIMDLYFRGVGENDDLQIKIAMSKILGDWMFLCPSVEFANLFASRHNKVFFYYFNHFSDFLKENPLSGWVGVHHFHDVQYFFGHPFKTDLPYAKPNYTENEKRFSVEMIELITSFAKTGWPRTGRHYSWPLFGPRGGPALQLNATSAGLVDLPRAGLCARTWSLPAGHCASP